MAQKYRIRPFCVKGGPSQKKGAVLYFEPVTLIELSWCEEKPTSFLSVHAADGEVCPNAGDFSRISELNTS